MSKIKEYLADAFLIGCGLAFLVWFIIAKFVNVNWLEPTPVKWWIEVVLFVIILVIGIERFVDDLKDE